MALNKIRILLLFACLFFAQGRDAVAGPITFNTALPVHSGEVIVREQVIYKRATEDGASVARRLQVVVAPTVLVYGLHTRVTLFGIFPVLSKSLELTMPSGVVRRSVAGFGDMTTLLRVTALAVDRPGETFRLAPFVGLKLPTGVAGEAGSIGRFPQPLQLGSGAWDPIVGTIFTWQTLRWQWDASASYQLRTQAQEFAIGDEARADTSFQYRIVPWGELGEGVPSYLFAVLEANGIWQGQNSYRSARNPDSGGTTVFVAPGVQWVSERIVLEAALQLPAFQSGGQRLRVDWAGRLSLRANF